MSADEVKTPAQLREFLIELTKEERPDITDSEANDIIETIMKFCRTPDTVAAFMEGYLTK